MSYQEARLPEVGMQWEMVSPGDIVILFISCRAPTAELYSVPLRKYDSSICFFSGPRCFFFC